MDHQYAIEYGFQALKCVIPNEIPELRDVLGSIPNCKCQYDYTPKRIFYGKGPKGEAPYLSTTNNSIQLVIEDDVKNGAKSLIKKELQKFGKALRFNVKSEMKFQKKEINYKPFIQICQNHGTNDFLHEAELCRFEELVTTALIEMELSIIDDFFEKEMVQLKTMCYKTGRKAAKVKRERAEKKKEAQS